MDINTFFGLLDIVTLSLRKIYKKAECGKLKTEKGLPGLINQVLCYLHVSNHSLALLSQFREKQSGFQRCTQQHELC